MIHDQIKEHVFESKLLQGNRAGESAERILKVYLPRDYDPSRSEAYPVLYVLAPWTSAGRQLFDWKSFKESLPERLNRLIDEKKMAPSVVVAPDLFTSYGGSQYIDSDFFGPHGSCIVSEIIPYIEKTYHVRNDPEGRGVFGRSSGGYGALRLALDFPGVFGHVASHSGDLGFDNMFLGDLNSFPRLLGRHKDDVEGYVQKLWKKSKIEGYQVHLLMLLGSCGFYSPNFKSPLGYDIPIDLHTGTIDWDVWKRWKSHDPLQIVKERPEGLQSLKTLYIECGIKDQYHLLYGARQIHEELNKLEIDHEYQEFDDNHSGTDYRYDISLPMLAGMG